MSSPSILPPAVTSEKANSAEADVCPAERTAFFEELAARFGTPFYVYDAARIDERYGELTAVFPEEIRSELYFSFKANPNPIVAGRMWERGCRADLTSPGEIAAAVEAGFDLGEALYGGPGKSELEFAHAIEMGIRQFSIESPHDLRALSEAAHAGDVEVKALIRINPLQTPKAKLAMSGVASQFGFEEEDLRTAGAAALADAGDRIRIVGVHVYWGTQIGDAEALLSSFEETIRLAGELSEQLGFPLEILNLGGGFPWPYAAGGVGPDLSPLREGLARLAASGPASKATWWFESGRYLTASSGTLVSRVMDRKLSKDEREFLILDTGIHHLGGMSGLGRIPRFSIDLEVPEARRENPEITVDVVGQLCTPLDCIGRRIQIPEVQPGDLVSIPNVGAYGPTASVLGFLSRSAPMEILHHGGTVLAASRLRGGHEPLSLDS